MQKIVSKYALAAHLAIMAVAPLFLFPLLGPGMTATILLWLSAFGFVWVLMEPSRRRGELPHDARMRIAATALRDPLFWFSILLIVYSGVRALNGGISLAYDAELMVWAIRTPKAALLPASADVGAYYAFAAVISLAVIFQGVRFALGRSARVAFVLVSSVLSSFAAILFAFCVSYQVPSVVSLAFCPLDNPSYFGTAFGIQLLCSVVALFDTIANKWMRAEPLAALALSGNAIGLALFSPAPTVIVFALAFLIILVVSFICSRHFFGGSGSLRFAMAAFVALGAPVMYALATEDSPWMVSKVSAFKDLAIFPVDFFTLRQALSDIALRAWKESPWLGTGLGTFSLDVRFLATRDQWLVVSPLQQAVTNGWWQVLVERGVIGAAMIVLSLGMLFWTYFSRLIRSFRDIVFSPEHFIGAIVLLALLVLAFVDSSYLRPEVLILAGAYLSFSGGAFPSRTRGDGSGKES